MAKYIYDEFRITGLNLVYKVHLDFNASFLILRVNLVRSID